MRWLFPQSSSDRHKLSVFFPFVWPVQHISRTKIPQSTCVCVCRDAFTDDRTGPLLASKPAWAGSGGRHPCEESAADLEGGNSTSYDTFVQPPPPPPRAKPAKEVKKTAKVLRLALVYMHLAQL